MGTNTTSLFIQTISDESNKLRVALYFLFFPRRLSELLKVNVSLSETWRSAAHFFFCGNYNNCKREQREANVFFFPQWNSDVSGTFHCKHFVQTVRCYFKWAHRPEMIQHAIETITPDLKWLQIYATTFDLIFWNCITILIKDVKKYLKLN